MVAYEEVNTALNEVFFFSGRSENQPVYLDVEDDVTEALSARLSVAPSDVDVVIGRAVAQTLTNSHRGGPYAWHIRRLDDWLESERRDPPPFTAFLCALSIAAEHMRGDANFSANNYYQRLFEVLGVDDEETQKKLKLSARHTRRFWRTLNKWLEDHDYRFGRPTARLVNNAWKYVGYPVSQALVRDADRKKFREMFVQFGFSPHERLSEMEMQLHLADWMAGNGPSPWLKKLWSNSTLRERINNAAIAELESWDGTELGDDKPSRKLRWAAALPGFPAPCLELYLSSMETLSDEIRELVQYGKPTPEQRQAFGNCEQGIYLSPALGADFAILQPTSDIVLTALMAAAFQLEEPRSGLLYAHQPKPIIPMVKLTEGPYYREVSRTSLFSRHMILCHGKSLAQEARELFEACAQEDFREYSDNELTGLPTGWTLFKDVVPLAIPGNVQPKLETLVPLDAGVSMVVADGLPLGPGRWHADIPPVVVASSENDKLALELREEPSKAKDTVLQRVEANNGHCVLQLRDTEIDPGRELYVIALEGKAERGEKRVSLQQADLPRPLSRSGDDLAFDPSAGSGARGMSAVPIGNIKNLNASVRGMLAPSGKLPDPPPPSCSRPLDLSRDARFDDEKHGHVYCEGTLSETGSSCALGLGVHHWVCEPFRPGERPGAPRRMDCKKCGASVLTRNRIKKKATKEKSHSSGNNRFSHDIAAIRKVHDRTHSAISPDTLLDALSYLNAGSWGTFQSVITPASDEPWFAREFARALHDLGHVDVQLNRSLSRVEAWSVAPPVLVLDGQGNAYLSGFRCRNLKDAVRKALGSSGCQFREVEQERAPAVLRWSDLDGSDVRGVLSGIRDPHGRAIEVVSSPASGIALGMPRLSSMLEKLPAIHIDAPRDLQRFDLINGRWIQCPAASEPGAYRTTFAGRRYFLKDTDGICREGNFEIVKILAAGAQSRRLHAYDADRMEFHAALGCGPPGLLRRALVACSGKLPRRDGYRQIYACVDSATADAVLDRLYG